MMNCQDIARWLDQRELSELSAEETIAFQAHLAHCADCAAQCLVSKELSSFRTAVPPLPASLRERAQHLQHLCETTARERRTRRPVLIGSLLLLGAAASMFATAPWTDASTANQ
jgi:anti-sigma factor RsiW